MRVDITAAYDSLAPMDQVIIDSMIMALATKNKQVSELIAILRERMDAEKEVQAE